MKKQFKAALSLTAAVVSGLLLASCLEDKGYTDIIEGANGDKVLVSFYGAAGTPTNQAVTLPAGKDTVEYKMTVSVTASHKTKQSYALTIGTDESAIAAANASITNADDKFSMLPDSVWDLASKNVTIPGDTTEAPFFVTIYQYKLDKSKSYMLPLTVKGPDGTVVASNAGTAKLVFIGNSYAGAYVSNYSLDREGVGPVDFSEDPKILEAVDSKVLKTLGGFAAFNNPGIIFRFSVNTDNSVNIMADSEAAVIITATAGKTSTYDPATKTFHLYYEYKNASGLYRRFDEVLVKK